MLKRILAEATGSGKQRTFYHLKALIQTGALLKDMPQLKQKSWVWFQKQLDEGHGPALQSRSDYFIRTVPFGLKT